MLKRNLSANDDTPRKRERATRKPLKRERDTAETEDEVSPRDALLKEICGGRSLRPANTIETHAIVVTGQPLVSKTTCDALLRAIRAPHSLRPTHTVEKHTPVVPHDALLLQSIRAAPTKLTLRAAQPPTASTASSGTTRKALLHAICTPPRLRPTQTVEKRTPVVVDVRKELSGSLLRAIRARPALRPTRTVVKHQPVILATWASAGPAVVAAQAA